MLFVSCSSDDDGDAVVGELTQTEMLNNGSPWNFRNAEVVTVMRNELNLSNEELVAISEDGSFPTFNFNNNGTVLLTEGSTEITASFDILNGDIVLTASDNSTLILENIEVSENEFSFTTEYDYIENNDTSVSSFWTSRLFYE